MAISWLRNASRTALLISLRAAAQSCTATHGLSGFQKRVGESKGLNHWRRMAQNARVVAQDVVDRGKAEVEIRVVRDGNGDLDLPQPTEDLADDLDARSRRVRRRHHENESFMSVADPGMVARKGTCVDLSDDSRLAH
jgi:hypothetical protein